MNFGEIDRGRPPGKVVVPPEAFAPGWSDRPEEDVCIGLRLVPDTELEDARIEAYRRAKEIVPDHEKSEEATQVFHASFTDALMRWVVARGTCDVNDQTKAWPLWSDAPEDIAREHLTDLGLQRIYDEWELMRDGCDIGIPVASDEDIALLQTLAKRLPTLGKESRARELRCRRYLRRVLEELETVAEPASDRSDAVAVEG